MRGVSMSSTDWRLAAVCRPGGGHDPELWAALPTQSDHKIAKRLCLSCPALLACGKNLLAEEEMDNEFFKSRGVTRAAVWIPESARGRRKAIEKVRVTVEREEEYANEHRTYDTCAAQAPRNERRDQRRRPATAGRGWA